MPTPQSLSLSASLITVLPTVCNGGGVQVVELGQQQHLSIYLGYGWVIDIADVGKALTYAAKLSMKHGLPLARTVEKFIEDVV